MLSFMFQDGLVSCVRRVLDQIREFMFHKVLFKSSSAFIHKGCSMTKIMYSSTLSNSPPL